MQSQSGGVRAPRRQDTFDLRDQIVTGDDTVHPHQQQQMRQQQQQYITSDEEHSMMEDDSSISGDESEHQQRIHAHVHQHDYHQGGELDQMHDEHGEQMDDADMDGDGVDYMTDSSSSLSIPNESIDFDLVYSLTNFAATVEGQASVVKGDSLFLMDDSNSYWWLVRVLKTQEVGYIPAENIETPFERLARLNRHRNVDVSSLFVCGMA